MIQPNCRLLIRARSAAQSSPTIRDALKNNLVILGQATLPTPIGNLKARIPYWVTSRLAVDGALGTLLIDRYVRDIIPRTRSVILYEGSTIALSNSHVGEDEDDTENSNPQSDEPCNNVRVPRAISIAPHEPTQMLVRTEAAGLRFIQNHQKALTNDMILIANGLIEVKPATASWVTVANFKSVPARKHRNTVVENMLPSPRVILEVHNLEGNRDKKESTDERGDRNGWQEKTRIGRNHEAKRGEIIELLREFNPMWSHQLWKVIGTKHRIELAKRATPVYQLAYRAGHRTRDLEKT